VNGRHEFDGKLRDVSPSAIDREIARLHAERQREAGFSDAALDQRQRFERDYLLTVIDSDLFWLGSAQWPYRDPYFYGGAVDPQVYLTRPYAPLDQRMRAFVNYARALPALLDKIKSNLRTPMPRTYVDIGRLTFGGLAQYLDKDVPGIFSSIHDAQLQAAFLAALRDTCQQFAPGQSLSDCVAKEVADKPKGSPVEAAREQVKELRAFVEAQHLVTIPGTEEAKVDEAPPYQRWNFAYINIPGPYERTCHPFTTFRRQILSGPPRSSRLICRGRPCSSSRRLTK
jgi:hypothetical protein